MPEFKTIRQTVRTQAADYGGAGGVSRHPDWEPLSCQRQRTGGNAGEHEPQTERR